MGSAADTRLAAVQRRRGQLPADVTGFVGRRAELARLCTLLATARLVTVTGPGGVGKTRVALRAAAGAADRYPDGVCFVDLSGVRDPALLADTIARGLGLRAKDGLARAIGHLRDRERLLVLDTCEHMVDGCATFAEALLREAPGVTLLVTSRQPLDVPGEHTLSVPPLPVPGPDGAGSGHDDAAELFTQRAVAAVPSFRLTDETRADVARLCRRLDGIPLAIELAAVRLRALPLPELADRIAEDRFHVLDGGRRGAVPRHQTLRTAIAWSYDLCTPAEREVWARLSVFAGTFDVAAAEHVCAAPGAPGRRSEFLEPLIGLVDKSVVLREGANGSRYRLPDTLREFGAERLGADGDACRERHLSYCLGTVRRFRDGIGGDGRCGRPRELPVGYDDLRAALDFGLSRPGPGRPAPGGGAGQAASRGVVGQAAPRSWAEAAELATALRAYWVISGRLGDGRYWLGQVLERFPAPSPQRAHALLTRACLGTLQGEAADAVRDAREGIRIANGLGAVRLEARGHLCLHAALTIGGWHEDAAAAGAEAEHRLTALCDEAGLILLGIQQAHLSQLMGRPEPAIRHCEQALRRGRNAERAVRTDGSGEPWPDGYAHTVTALAYLQLPAQDDRCAAAAVRGLRAAHDRGDVVGTAYALEALAWLAAARGRPMRAAWLTGAADPLWERAGKRLSGTAIMLEAHQRAVKTALGGLGEDRFAALRAQGAACALDQVVAAATADTDEVGAVRAVAPDGATVTGKPQPAAGPGAAGPEVTGPGAAGPEAGPGAAGRPSGPGLGGLTSRERQIAALVANGLSNREIAARLVISKRTVDAHVEHIFGKLGISSRVQLTVWLQGQSPDTRPRPDRRCLPSAHWDSSSTLRGAGLLP